MYDTENMRRVWSRVTAGEHPAETAETACPRDRDTILREYIDGENASASFYDRLAARMSCRTCAAMFRSMARDERRHGRYLQTEYFLSAGDTFAPKKENTGRMTVSKALRESYLAEIKTAENYEREATLPSWTEKQRAVFREMARDERRHAENLRTLIKKMMA